MIIVKVLIVFAALCGMSIPIIYALFILTIEKDIKREGDKIKKEKEFWKARLSKRFTRQDVISDEAIEFINNYGYKLRILQYVQAKKLKESQK